MRQVRTRPSFSDLTRPLDSSTCRCCTVRIEKDYVFEGPAGKARLPDLFAGRRQLIIYHFMFHRDRGEGCPGCSPLTW